MSWKYSVTFLSYFAHRISLNKRPRYSKRPPPNKRPSPRPYCQTSASLPLLPRSLGYKGYIENLFLFPPHLQFLSFNWGGIGTAEKVP